MAVMVEPAAAVIRAVAAPLARNSPLAGTTRFDQPRDRAAGKFQNAAVKNQRAAGANCETVALKAPPSIVSGFESVAVPSTVRSLAGNGIVGNGAVEVSR